MNLPLTPELVTIGSGKRVWWKCANGHEWQAQIASRVTGIGCAKCSKKRASAEHNLLAVNPALLAHWDKTRNTNSPSSFTPNSNRKAWWLCPKGHSFDMSIKDFARRQKCPYCSGKRVDKSNSVAAIFPALAKYWDYSKNPGLTPEQVARSSGIKFWWSCSTCDYSWSASPNQSTRHRVEVYCRLCRRMQK
jgi:hypothetical protein